MYGAQIKLGIARQAAANSWVTLATSFHGIALTAETLGIEQAEVISQNLTGSFQQGASYQGTTKINGTLSFEVTPRNLGIILAAAVDGTPTVVTSASVTKYTFIPNTIDFSPTLINNPFTVYKQFSDSSSAELYYDTQWGQLDLTFSQGQFLKGQATMVGGTRLPTGIGSLSVLPAGSDVGRLFPWNVASVSYGGAAISQASDITVSLNLNIDGLYGLNASLAPIKFTRTGFQEVTVNGTFYMNDRSMLNNFVTNTQQQLLITSVNTVAAIQSGYYDTLLIDIPQLKITAFKPGASGPGEVSVKFTGRGLLDPTSNYTIQYVQTNSYAAGY
jgi:hypothetical protein